MKAKPLTAKERKKFLSLHDRIMGYGKTLDRTETKIYKQLRKKSEKFLHQKMDREIRGLLRMAKTVMK
jgi:hypothetical protein